MAKSNFPFPVDEHGDLILALAPLFKTLQDLAKQCECAFPVELLLIDADDSIIFEVELQAPEGPVSSRRDPNEKLAPINWPITVRAADARGREWEQTIEGPTVQ
jgi:hypothetical protein